MPLYEYHCEDCQTQSEVLVRSSSEQVTCPKCGSQRLTKLLSTFSARAGSSDTGCGSCELGGTCGMNSPPRGGCGHGGGCGCH